MKKLIIITLFLIAAKIASAQGIKFISQPSLQDVFGAAKLENKYVLVDAFTTWCIPCRELDAKTFQNKEVGEQVNQNFLAIKIQMDRTAADSDYIKGWYEDARRMEREFEISAYPSVLVLNSSGILAGKILGFREPADFIQELNSVLEKFKGFENQYNAYLNGQKDSAFVKKMVGQAKEIGNNKLAHEIAQTYINGLSNDEAFLRKNLDFIYKYTEKTSDRGFKIFREHGKRADGIFGTTFKMRSSKKVNSIIYDEEIAPHIRKKDPDWVSIHSRIKNEYGDLNAEFYYGVRMGHAMEYENWTEFGKFYSLYFKTAFDHSTFHINNVSYLVFKHISDPKVLNFAAKTMSYSIDHYDQTNYSAYDTYAGILYKLGRVKEAITWQEKAVKGAPQEKEIAENLSKMKRGEKIW